MIRIRPPYINSFWALLLSALLVAGPDIAFAQGPSGAIPENARAKSYGGGWECNRGYRETKGACAAVKVPANAYATDTSYGRGWDCDWGYKEITRRAGRCVAVKPPTNAYVHASGDRWECNRGYRKAGESCVAVDVPANGYLADTSYGTGWKCERKYRAVGDRCVAVKVPKNGYFVDASYGPGWKCLRGFQAVQNTCVSIKIPAYAHLDYSGNDWECNRPYEKRRGRCWPPGEKEFR